METATWILVVILSVALAIFLIVGIILLIKLIGIANEAKKIVATGQQIANKADDIVDNVKGVTSVGGIVRNFATHVMENQERRYAAEDAAREEVERAEAEAREAEEKAAAARAKALEAAKKSTTKKPAKK